MEDTFAIIHDDESLENTFKESSILLSKKDFPYSFDLFPIHWLIIYKVSSVQKIRKYSIVTENNLKRVFNRFHNQSSILFFNKESIFNKRTEVDSSNDQNAYNLKKTTMVHQHCKITLAQKTHIIN